MTNPATDFVASLACSAFSPCARDAVHRFAMPGLGLRAVHGLLGIFLKNYEKVTGGTPGTFLPRACNFFENVRASVQFAKTHAPQGTTANGQGLGTRGSVRAAAVMSRLSRRPTPNSPASPPPGLISGYPPRRDHHPFRPAPRRHWAPPRRNWRSRTRHGCH